ncbi:hypothetical protein NK6_5401 [Bradyrhizobium diazoefficiens]|uniref:Uncharacterized protein n=1 Tax=Bradyrhizobium diazoefficiens TaxID=1355477 RepID=A0A0E3VV53_9BRAD|nr:hypothetical protein NK6_5401 [Bradyrhizobium diazoefficiens]
MEPYVWMKATLKAIATGHPQSRIDEWDANVAYGFLAKLSPVCGGRLKDLLGNSAGGVGHLLNDLAGKRPTGQVGQSAMGVEKL